MMLQNILYGKYSVEKKTASTVSKILDDLFCIDFLNLLQNHKRM